MLVYVHIPECMYIIRIIYGVYRSRTQVLMPIFTEQFAAGMK